MGATQIAAVAAAEAVPAAAAEVVAAAGMEAQQERQPAVQLQAAVPVRPQPARQREFSKDFSLACRLVRQWNRPELSQRNQLVRNRER